MDHLYKRQSYRYDLPIELVAQHPLKNRGESRLMRVDRKSGTISHHTFADICDFLLPNDVLVINNTRVIPARLHGHKLTGAVVEVLLVTPLTDVQWLCLVKPGNKIKTGTKIVFAPELSAEVISHEGDGLRRLQFQCDGVFMEVLQKVGEIPLPPYIARKPEKTDESAYQTVYATHDGSVATATAGLHFTDEILQKIQYKGTKIVDVVLHIGPGTFRPVDVDDIRGHKMHSEYCEVSPQTAQVINTARRAGHRIVSVGTTSTRTLESFLSGDQIVPGKKWTDIFIYPGTEIKSVDVQITNFHMPESTLLMMICAFAGFELIIEAYQQAVEERYRFFSYGDAMLIV
jgi:S-adenosylmethionine:tRNA ribosyltransferase-isomerase